MDNEIIEYLRREGQPRSALQVSKGVGNVNSTAKDANPTLYRLKKEGRVKQMGTVEGRQTPLWGLAQGESSHGNQDHDHLVLQDPPLPRPLSTDVGKPTAHGAVAGTSATHSAQSTNVVIGEITDELRRLSIEPWKETLKKNRQELRTGILVCNFSPELYKLPLTVIECARIEGNPDNVTQVDELIMILLTKTKEHFDKFCSVLEENGYEQWAEKMRGVEPPPSPAAPVEPPLSPAAPKLPCCYIL